MNVARSTLGSTLASFTLMSLLAVPLQNAGGAPPQNAPKPKPPAAKPGDQAAKPAPQQAAPEQPAPQAPAAGADAKGADAAGKPSAGSDTALANRYIRAAEIGDEHKWLAGLQGKWKTLTTQRITPTATAMESTGTSEFQVFMDGRFLLENNKSGGGAGVSQGMGIIGFNNLTRKFERVWFDTHSTAMVKSEGDYDKDHDEIRWTDQWCDPGTGQVVTTQSTLRRTSDKELLFTQIETLPNKSAFTMLRVQYKKAE
jgi:hypothetical protein